MITAARPGILQAYHLSHSSNGGGCIIRTAVKYNRPATNSLRSNKKKIRKRAKSAHISTYCICILLHILILLVALQRPLYCSTALYYSIALSIWTCQLPVLPKLPINYTSRQCVRATTHRRATPTDGTDTSAASYGTYARCHTFVI